MHIVEGYLPAPHAAAWTLIAAPAVTLGFTTIARRTREDPASRSLLGACAGFVFLLSALKLPSVAGSSSHPTGIGLGGILLGPAAMFAIGTVVLLFQALLLGHGGITTLGANTFAMSIAGSAIAWLVHGGCVRAGVGRAPAVFLATVLADLGTYACTAFQLGLAFPSGSGGASASFLEFLAVFLPVQLPIAVVEGFLSVAVVRALDLRTRPDGLGPSSLETSP